MSERNGPRESTGQSAAQRADTAMQERVHMARRQDAKLVVTTNPVRMDDHHIVVQASVIAGNGAAGSGIAAVTVSAPENWAAAIQFAEAEAINRAMDLLALPRPTARAAMPEPKAVATPAVSPAESPERAEPAPPSRSTPVASESGTPEFVGAIRRVNGAPPPSSDDDDLEMAEYQWSAFWRVVRAIGETNRTIEQRLGHPANTGTPKQAVAELIELGNLADIRRGQLID